MSLPESPMHDPLITLLTDFGTDDAYVAQMKGQILCVCPQARIIDISHSIPPQDIVYGAMMLAQSAPFFPSGTIHVVVVDPGVGTDRPLVAVEINTRTSADELHRWQRFVLPDNGLIDLLVQQFGVVGVTRLTDEQYWRPRPSHTFHGRDILGPVAAHWSRGCARQRFGPESRLQATLKWPTPQSAEGWLTGEILYVDHFGNAVTNLPADCVKVVSGQQMIVHIGERPLITVMAQTYGQRAVGETIALVGSHGFLEIAVVGGNAATSHGLRRGNLVKIAVQTLAESKSNGAL